MLVSLACVGSNLSTTQPVPSLTSIPEEIKWVIYNNAELGFSANIPEGWIIEVNPISQNDPSRGVTWALSPEDIGPDETVIGVTLLPVIGQLTPSQLMPLAEQYIEKNTFSIIRPAEETVIDSYPAVWFIGDLNVDFRSYIAFVSTPNGLYALMVGGHQAYEDLIQYYYDEFINRFSLIDK
jgi:hypothetical protein